MLMATTAPVTLSQFARAMIGEGVQDAVSLDGGSSTCLFYRGVVLIHPGRRLSNMLILAEAPKALGAANRTQSNVGYLNQ